MSDVVKLELAQSSATTWHADARFGAYRILEVEVDWFTASAPRQAALLGSFSTLEEAQAACQADFERRVRECLVPDPSMEALKAERDALREGLRLITRVSEESAAVMRDPVRTGDWAGSETTAQQFDRIATRARSLLEGGE